MQWYLSGWSGTGVGHQVMWPGIVWYHDDELPRPFFKSALPFGSPAPVLLLWLHSLSWPGAGRAPSPQALTCLGPGCHTVPVTLPQGPGLKFRAWDTIPDLRILFPHEVGKSLMTVIWLSDVSNISLIFFWEAPTPIFGGLDTGIPGFHSLH